MTRIFFRAQGPPVAQGSPRIGRHGKKAVILLDSVALERWREHVRICAVTAARDFDRWVEVPTTITVEKRQVKTTRRVCFNEPVVVQAKFFFPTPKSRRFGDVCDVKPDLDKLYRAIGDALADARIIFDDSRIVGWPTCPGKFYGNPCAEIAIQSLLDYESRAAPLFTTRPDD